VSETKPKMPRQINIALLEKLDKFIEDNYISPDSVPPNTLFLPAQFGTELYRSKKNEKEGTV